MFPCAYKAWVFLKPAFIRSSVWSPCRGLYLYCLLCRITVHGTWCINMQSKNVDNTRGNGKKPRGGRLGFSAINTATELPLSGRPTRPLCPRPSLLQHRKSHSRPNPDGRSPYCDTKPRHVPSPQRSCWGLTLSDRWRPLAVRRRAAR